jgi:hypothetical protein
MRAYVKMKTSTESSSNYTVYPCSAIDTGLYDKNGNKIYFSTVFNNDADDISINSSYEVGS